MDPFSRLPAELRLKIFAFTDLVVRERSGRKAGLHVYDGVFSNPVRHDMYWHPEPGCYCPGKFANELLDRRNNPYYSEIFEVAFSQNRIILGGHITSMLDFLQTYIEEVKYIRDVEFQFDDEVIEAWTEPHNTFFMDWDDVVNFVRKHFNLSNLTLSLNAAQSIPIYHDQQMIETRAGDFRLDAYIGIVLPLRRMGLDEGLKRFYAFWACYHFYEATAEREVMGESYQALDKVPLSRRDLSYPWRDFEKEKKEDRELDQRKTKGKSRGKNKNQPRTNNESDRSGMI